MIFIHLKNRDVEYKFTLYDKYTLIRGYSATGKTTLYNLIDSFSQNPINVQCMAYSKLKVLPSVTTAEALRAELHCKDEVFIVDENARTLKIHGFEQILNNSDNYFIIISREHTFRNLSIGLRSLTVIKSSGRFHWLEQQYKNIKFGIANKYIVEDSKSGYQFLKQFSSKIVSVGDYLHLKSSGKDLFAKAIKQYDESHIDDSLCIIYDKSGISTTYDDINEAKRKLKNIQLFELAWDSFEGYLLDSSVYKDFSFAEYSCRFNSFEKYCTQVLSKIVATFPGCKYEKGKLLKCFKPTRCYDCDKKGNCPYSNYNFKDLIYGDVKEIASTEDIISYNNSISDKDHEIGQIQAF